VSDRDMLTFLQDVALGRIEATATQVRAASSALPFLHAKKGEGGKKDEQAIRAKKAANKFAALTPPLKMVANNGK
jgi:phage terminase small subunit